MTREAKRQNFRTSGANDGTSERSERVTGHGTTSEVKFCR